MGFTVHQVSGVKFSLGISIQNNTHTENPAILFLRLAAEYTAG